MRGLFVFNKIKYPITNIYAQLLKTKQLQLKLLLLLRNTSSNNSFYYFYNKKKLILKLRKWELTQLILTKRISLYLKK